MLVHLDLYLDELRLTDPKAWMAEKARRVEEEMIDSGEADPEEFLKLKPPPDLTFFGKCASNPHSKLISREDSERLRAVIEEIRWARAQKNTAAAAAGKYTRNP